MEAPRESGSADLLMTRHVKSLPRTFTAGDPYIVPSSTSGNSSASLRTVSKLIFFLGTEMLSATIDRLSALGHGGLFARVLHKQIGAEQGFWFASSPAADLPFSADIFHIRMLRQVE